MGGRTVPKGKATNFKNKERKDGVWMTTLDQETWKKVFSSDAMRYASEEGLSGPFDTIVTFGDQVVRVTVTELRGKQRMATCTYNLDGKR